MLCLQRGFSNPFVFCPRKTIREKCAALPESFRIGNARSFSLLLFSFPRLMPFFSADPDSIFFGVAGTRKKCESVDNFGRMLYNDRESGCGQGLFFALRMFCPSEKKCVGAAPSHKTSSHPFRREGDSPEAYGGSPEGHRALAGETGQKDKSNREKQGRLDCVRLRKDFYGKIFRNRRLSR